MDPIKNTPPPETKLHFLDYWRIIRVRKTVILAVFLLVVITATLVTFILPESFESTARIRVERDVSDIDPLAGKQYGANTYDPYFIQTEFEVIQSRTILMRVILTLKLQERWAKKYGAPQPLSEQEAFELMRNVIDLRPERNTSLIGIRVYSDKPEEAAEIANAIASEYQRYRLDQRKEMSTRGIEALRETAAKQEADIQVMQDELETLRAKIGILDDDPSGMTASRSLTVQTFQRIEASRIDAERVLIGKEKLLTELQTKSPEALRHSLPTALDQPDFLYNELLGQLSFAQQQLVKAEQDLGPENSEVLRIKAQVTELNRKIEERIAGILSGLQAQVASAKAQVVQLTDEVKQARDKEIELTERSRPFYDKKRKLEEMIRFRNILALKMLSENTDKELPKSAIVAIVDQATPALKAVRPNKTLNITLGIVVGLVVGIGLAFFIEYLDTSVKTIDDVERALQSPVLGIIPQNVGLLIHEGAESPHAEAYRVLRTNILFSRKDDKLNTVAVVSAGAGEGKTTTCFNLATVFAQSEHRVLVVDSDLRRPTLHKLMKVSNSAGLTSYLLKQNTLDQVIQTSSLPNLHFMPSGKLPSSSLGILSSPQMKELISELKQRYDFVFFDSPPIMGVSDASILASEVDMTVQVIQYRRYPQPMNIRAKQMIEKVGGRLIGIVLNNINMSQDESYYYYSGYYHDYYYARKDDDQGQGDEGKTPTKPVKGKAAPAAKPEPETPVAEGDKDKVEIRQKY
jgi:succinoglycan biosynthesis transport protein ExoP